MTVRDSCLDLETPTGLMRTYVYEPEAFGTPPTRYPGLPLYSEIFQQTEPIKRLATQFASQGYVVMVPEIYHEDLPLGTVLGYDDEGKDKGNLLKKTTPLSTFDDDARVVIEALNKHPACNGQIGVVGFCIGGHLSFRCALNPEVKAAICFYPTDIHSGTLGKGEKADSLERCGEISGELMMIWGRQDPHIPDAGRMKIYQRLSEAGVTFTWHEFNAAHAFMRDEGDRHNAAVAQVCRTLAFEMLHRTLSG